MSMDSVSLGFGGTSRFSGNRGRTADGMSEWGTLSSPFFDIGHLIFPIAEGSAQVVPVLLPSESAHQCGHSQDV